MMYKSIFNTVSVALLAVFFCMGCGGSASLNVPAPTVTTFVDERDGKTYKKVTIGKQTWMAENLNYVAEGSKCYGEGAPGDKFSSEEIQANCDKYGRLYNWDTAMKSCPTGWHLPSDAEWTTLTDAVGSDKTVGKRLKSASGWNNVEVPSGTINGNGSDDYGFSALPGGRGSVIPGSRSGFIFVVVGTYGVWWSATEIATNIVYNRGMGSVAEGVFRDNGGANGDIYSVRCVED